MKIASVDIGTNAIKSKIFKTTPASIEFIQGIRSPIRLGSDVFNEGNLSNFKVSIYMRGMVDFSTKYQTRFLWTIWQTHLPLKKQSSHLQLQD